MRHMAWTWLLAIGLLSGWARAQTIVVASTTSTEQSGLFAHLLPRFRQVTGIEVKVVALGTGQALDMARRGDADVVFVHDKEAEERFVAEGWGVQRHDVMVTDFVLVGPQVDPAGTMGHDIVAALRQIARANAPFVSRGDNSGTHAAELRYWALAGQPTPGRGYRSCGCGMGSALNMAAGIGAYVLTDRGTWLRFKNRAQLSVLVEGDARLLNPYGVILVNPARHPHVKAAEGQAFIDWITGPAGQSAIASFAVGGGRPFRPNVSR